MKLIRKPPEEPVSHDPTIRKRVWLRAGELGPLTQVAQARFEPGQLAPAHSHADMAELFIVSAGQATITLDGEAHLLEAGDALLVEVGEVHEVANRGDQPLLLTYFGLRWPPAEVGG